MRCTQATITNEPFELDYGERNETYITVIKVIGVVGQDAFLEGTNTRRNRKQENTARTRQSEGKYFPKT